MAVITAGISALLLFCALSEAGHRGHDGARTAAILEAGVLVPLAALGAFLSTVLLGLKCDESCIEGPSPPWWHTTDAWQWQAQCFVAVLGLGAAGLALALLVRRRYRLAIISMTIAAASFGAWAAFLAPFGDRLGI